MKKIVRVNRYREDDGVYESCSICGRDMFSVRDILIDKETDRYVCSKCKMIHKLDTVRCRDLFGEE